MPDGRIPRSQGPLKMKAAEVTGDVDDLADKIEPGDGSGFERLRRELRCIDAAQCHLRGAVALGAIRLDAPLLHRSDHVKEKLVGEIPKALRPAHRVSTDQCDP